MKGKKIVVTISSMEPFLILPFIEPPYFASIGIVHNLYIGCRLISLLIVILLYLQKRKLSKYVIWFCIQYVPFLIASIYTPFDRNLGGAVSYTITCIGLCCCLTYNIKFNLKETINTLFYFFMACMFIEVYTVFKYPLGIYNIQEAIHYKRYWWFLGHQNGTILYVYPTIFVSYIYAKTHPNIKLHIRELICVLLSIIVILKTWSATSVLGLIIVVLGFLYNYFNKKSRIISLKIGFLLSIVVFWQIILLRNQKYFADFITNVLKRDVTLTSRTQIWDAAIALIEQRTLLGYGQNSYIWERIIPIGSAHNKYLQLLIDGGIFYLLLFGGLIWMSAKVVDKYREENRIIQLLILECFALLIQMQVEGYMSAIFMLLFVFAYYSEKIVDLIRDYGKKIK